MTTMQERFATPIVCSGAVACLLLSLLAIGGCAKNAVVSETPPTQVRRAELDQYLIQLGDELSIKFFYNPELNETVRVRPDGRISLQLVDEVKAAGLAPHELDKTLTALYARELRDPAISVIVRTFASRQLYVGGEVNQPQLVELTASNMTPLQAVVAAGGLRDTANLEEVLLIRRGPDNRPISFGIDLSKSLYNAGDSSRIYLQPDDIVYVPKSGIAVANTFVRQYIRDLFLYNGFGISYEITDLVEGN